MELLKLRRRLVVAKRGHKLLKDKLEGLMQEFLAFASEYKRYRLQVDEELPYVLKIFVLAEITSSRQITEDALEGTRQDLRIGQARRDGTFEYQPSHEDQSHACRPINRPQQGSSRRSPASREFLAVCLHHHELAR
jgi:hypothetical protein